MGSQAGFIVVFDGAYAAKRTGPTVDRRRGDRGDAASS